MEPEHDRPWPILSLVGGKWTTFRGFAQEVADTLLARLGRPRHISTRHLRIGGGDDFPTDPAARERWIKAAACDTGATPARAGLLLDRYGTTALSVLAHESAHPAPALADAPGWTLAEIDWIVRNEHVVHLEDIVLRRTTLVIEGRLTGRDLASLAQTAAVALGWDEARRLAELRQTTTLLALRYRLVLE